MKKPLRVLLVEDSDDDAELVLRTLRRGFDVEVERVETAEAMNEALDRPWDVVVSDYSMPRFSGPAAYGVLRAKGLDLPFIIASGTIGEDVAIATMKLGVNDYLLKGNLARLVPAIERELREAEGRRTRRALEEQLRQSQKMEAIGRLAGGVAHDFNNLLSIIISYSSLVLAELPEDMPMRADVGEIHTAALRAADLTRQLLAFGRKQVLKPATVDLGAVLSRMQDMLRRLVGEDVSLTVTNVADLGTTLLDPGQVEQVVLNLVVNARDAMPTGGKLTIESANVTLDDSYASQHEGVTPGAHVMLAVSDTGSGMDAATQARIFEPFFTTKEPGKGTGLGLSTVFGIVKQSGGHIWVYSEVGNGTTFKLYFPRTNARAAASSGPLAPAPANGVERILLVEDNDALRVLACKVLRRHGYVVHDFPNGDAALDFLGAGSVEVDLLLTDVVMPGMNGRELADRLRSTRPLLKVLYMSGYTDDAIVRHGVLDRGVAFLQKPITPALLTQKVREVLDT
jgi:signal transduction histidine kinase